jgi:hypothetical protein
MTLMTTAGSTNVGSETDEYYRSASTFGHDSNTSGAAVGDAKSFEHSQLMESIRPPINTPELQDPPGLQFPLFPFQRKALAWMKLQARLD